MTGSPVIVALDTADPAVLTHLAGALGPSVGGLKVGLEAFTALGPSAVHTVRDAHGGTDAPRIFLDLKLHDIPNTVARAAAVAADLGVDMLTVHAAGGPAMIAAAAAAAPAVQVLGVTVLTSLDDTALAAVGQPPAAAQVRRLARVAVDAGAAGLVCAVSDVTALRDDLGPDVTLVVPGIRPEGAAAGDQARTGTPATAVRAGADWLVVGRPVTVADDPVAAAEQIAAEAREAVR